MAVNYVIIPKHNPLDREAPPKFYAQAKSKGVLTFRKLSKEISYGSSTVSDTDGMAVLNDLVKVLRRHLENGEIVCFGDFGSFQINIGSDGAETPDKFHNSMTRNPKVTFRPGVVLKEMLSTLKYVKEK